jgi:cell division protein FtsI/penicillin-binding protein 2
MVNQPTFNPNDRSQLKPAQYKNRAAMDLLEPGSTIKPFVVAAALASGQYTRDSVLDTSPGMIKVGSKLIEATVERQMNGALDSDWRSTGVVHSLSLPLSVFEV